MCRINLSSLLKLQGIICSIFIVAVGSVESKTSTLTPAVSFRRLSNHLSQTFPIKPVNRSLRSSVGYAIFQTQSPPLQITESLSTSIANIHPHVLKKKSFLAQVAKALTKSTTPIADVRSNTLRNGFGTNTACTAFLVPRGGEDEYDNESSVDEPSDEEEREENSSEEDVDERSPSLTNPLLSFLSLKPNQQQSLAEYISSRGSNVARYAYLLVRAARRACQAGVRAMFCNTSSTSNEESDSGDDFEVGSGAEGPHVLHTLMGRTAYVIEEMYAAAIRPDEEMLGDGDETSNSKIHSHSRHQGRGHKKRKRRKHSSEAALVCNGGGIDDKPQPNHDLALLQMAKQYGANIPTEDNGKLSKKYQSIMLSSQVTLTEALQKANADARFLVCYISPKAKGGGGPSRNNKIAIPNLLSPDLVKMVNRKPLGKKQAESTGSFYVWICNGDESSTSPSDIQNAMKRLKVKPPTSSSKKSKSKGEAPILAIIYPASTVDTSTQRLKVSPRLLAQHHCHPPPSTPETLMAWMSSIRKRHLREYAKLQHDRKEVRLLEERTKGYATSIKEDAQRQKEEEQKLQIQKEKEEQERIRKEKLEERRQLLLESLPDEPEAGVTEGVITIALRFTDGKRDQRRFLAAETTTNDVLNWVDAVHGMEREKVVLTTMNGQKTFVYVEEKKVLDGDEEDVSEEEEDDNGEEDVVIMTLEDAGLGKMTALRVSELVEEEGDGEQENDENEENEG